jgi:hypothetical protein
MNTAHATSDQIACRAIGARVMDSDLLVRHYFELVAWMANAEEGEVLAPFCQQTAWFKEVGWELERRGLLTVN